eukprot:m.26185 g.26185  ORF g.26185 m.26185 type:complete len:368 (+) comp4555_c0_seq1:343-1446(+)
MTHRRQRDAQRSVHSPDTPACSTMSHQHRDQKQPFLNAVRAGATAVRRSPQMVRKAFGKAKAKMGHSKQYSELNDCDSNGWLHADEKVMVGVSYEVKYLGSIEVNYTPASAAQNNAWAIEAMRAVKDYAKSSGPVHKLTVSVGRITLTSAEGEVVMRHSTSRIAYSTVDHDHARLFCYVALPKTASTPLCHVFWTKSPKKSYEMTFTCAQAFDANYRAWQENRGAAMVKATASEAGDIEPIKALPSPRPIRKTMGDVRSSSPLVGRSESPAPGGSSTSSTPSEESAAQTTSKPVDRIADASDPGAPSVPVIPTIELDIDDDDDDMSAVDAYFTQLSEARSAPNLLEIGVEPEHFNNAASEGSEVSDW